MCDQNRAITILGEVYALCNPIFGNLIKDAYLYGSFARGDYRTDSDVDILLTVDLDADTIAASRMAVAEQVSDLSLKHDVTVSVAIKPHEQFQKYAHISPYYQNILREGIKYAC